MSTSPVRRRSRPSPRGLDFWPGPIAVEPLPGGITNHNYRVSAGGRRSSPGSCEPRPLLGIDRRNEVVCQRAAHALGVAPGVVLKGAGCSSANTSRPGRWTRPASASRPSCRGWRPCSGRSTTVGTGLTGRSSISRPSRPSPPTRERAGRWARSCPTTLMTCSPTRGGYRVGSGRSCRRLSQRPALREHPRRWRPGLAGRLGIRRGRPPALRPGGGLGELWIFQGDGR